MVMVVAVPEGTKAEVGSRTLRKTHKEVQAKEEEQEAGH